MPRDGARKRWVFTLNNYTTEEYQKVIDTLTVLKPTYAIVAKETGENGTPHLQGFVSLTKRIRMMPLKTLISPRCHLEPALGTDMDNQTYCSKQDESPWQLGEPRTSVSEKGGNSRNAVNVVREILNGKSIEDIFSDSDLAPALIVHNKNIKTVISDIKQERETKKLKLEFENVQLRPFQKMCMDILNGPVCNRSVYWFWDHQGNTGKTWFSKYLVAMHDAIRLENGKSADLKYAYTGQRIVIFDFSRSTMDRINYEAIEAIKNGLVFSGKYESTAKIHSIPHVLCFANCEPELQKLSMDRWKVHSITEINLELRGKCFS